MHRHDPLWIALGIAWVLILFVGLLLIDRPWKKKPPKTPEEQYEEWEGRQW